MSDLLLKIAGKDYPVWTDFYLRKNLEEVAHSFNFSINAKSEIFKIKKHDEVKIHLGGQLYTAGRIDTTRQRLSQSENTFAYTGRSYVRDLIDSMATTHYTDWYLSSIFEQLCGIYNVPFTQAEGVKTSIVKEFVLTAEPPWQKMMNETINQGLIITTDNRGGVILDKAGSQKLPVIMEEGVNFTELSAEDDGSKEFERYVVRSEGLEAQVKNELMPEGIHRPFDVQMDREAKYSELLKRAEVEKKRGQSKKYRMVVGGWEYAPGKYWDVNYQIKVTSPSFDLDRYLLISQLELYLKKRRKYAVLMLEDDAVYG